MRIARNFCAFVISMLFAAVAAAQSTPKQVHTSPQADPGVYSGRLKVDYPTPYELASEDSIRGILERVHAYVDQAAPVAVLDAATGEAVTDLNRLPAEVSLARTDFQILTYEWGVTYAGMLRSAADHGRRALPPVHRCSGSRRSRRWPRTCASSCPPAPRRLTTPCRRMAYRCAPSCCRRRLDDSGAMCAALIKAERAGLAGGKLRPWIDNYVKYVSTGQFRLEDGTLARNRPLPNSLWLDDLYMSVPCLAQAGKLTGERRYYDDAAKQMLQFAQRMFVQARSGLYMHGWVQGMEHHPTFYWARANGWALMATVELLEVLPENHPQRARILELLRAHAAGLDRHPGPRRSVASVARPARVLRGDLGQRHVRIRHRACHQSWLAGPPGIRATGLVGLERGGDEGECAAARSRAPAWARAWAGIPCSTCTAPCTCSPRMAMDRCCWPARR